MPVAGGGFDQCYNAQAVVAAESLLVVAAQVVQAPNDKQQIEPMLNKLDALLEDLGKPEPDAASGHGPPSADPGRQKALCRVQASPGCSGSSNR